jgi:hypothetical protein
VTDVAREGAQVDRSSGAQIIGGEMLEWSDADRIGPSFAMGRLLQRVVTERQPRRVLLAGPTAAALIGVLPTDIQIDVLIRSVPDARRIADAAALHEHVRLTCGGLDRYQPGTAYDLVVGLGGAARLLGPDSRGMSDADVVAALASHVAADGALLVDAFNAMGLQDLFAAEPDRDPDSDSEWAVGASGYDTRPLYRHEFHDALVVAGVTPAMEYAAFASPDCPGLLVTETALVAPGMRGQVVVLARQLGDVHFEARASLRDPRMLMDRVVSSGNSFALASSWVILALPGGTRPVEPTALPGVVCAETTISAHWARVVEYAADGNGTVTWGDDRADHIHSEGLVSRDLSLPVTATGTTLEQLLRDSCASRSHTAIRRLLGRYEAWLADNAQWTNGRNTHRFFATPDNVVIREDDSMTLFDSSWQCVNVASPADSFVHGLRRFSIRMLASAAPHPWRTEITPNELTLTLAAMVGKVVEEDAVVRTARIQARVLALLTDRQDEVAEILADLLEEGAGSRNLPAATETGFRELLARDRAMARVARDHEDQVGWLEGMLRMRDRYILELEKAILAYEETLTYRTVQLFRTPRRVVTDKARGAVVDALPPDFAARARRFIQRQTAGG